MPRWMLKPHTKHVLKSYCMDTNPCTHSLSWKNHGYDTFWQQQGKGWWYTGTSKPINSYSNGVSIGKWQRAQQSIYRSLWILLFFFNCLNLWTPATFFKVFFPPSFPSWTMCTSRGHKVNWKIKEFLLLGREMLGLRVFPPWPPVGRQQLKTWGHKDWMYIPYTVLDMSTWASGVPMAFLLSVPCTGDLLPHH